MNLLNKDTPLKGVSPFVLEHTANVTDKPIWFSAFGLGPGDKICARKIHRGAGSGFGKDNCGTSGPGLGKIEHREYAMFCEIPLCLCVGQTGLALTEPGEYEFVVSGPNIEAGLVIAGYTEWMLTCCPPAPCKTCD